jgi:hypothetical protein
VDGAAFVTDSALPVKAENLSQIQKNIGCGNKHLLHAVLMDSAFACADRNLTLNLDKKYSSTEINTGCSGLCIDTAPNRCGGASSQT